MIPEFLFSEYLRHAQEGHVGSMSKVADCYDRGTGLLLEIFLAALPRP
jgi:hypothetical protein